MSRGNIATELQRARERADLSFRVAAKAIGVGVSSIQRWEDGTIAPRADEMLRAADAYKVGVETLYGRVPHGIRPGLAEEAISIAGRLSELAARLDRVARGGEGTTGERARRAQTAQSPTPDARERDEAEALEARRKADAAKRRSAAKKKAPHRATG